MPPVDQVGTGTFDDPERVATRYWSEYLGAPIHVAARRPRLVPHGLELADYAGLYAFFRRGEPVVSVAADRLDSTRAFLAGLDADARRSPGGFARAMQSLSACVIGPAFVGYAADIPAVPSTATVRILGRDDAAAVDALRAKCQEWEWDHGGCSVEEDPAAGAFVGTECVAVAGYQPWGGTIAHISVIAHPSHRGCGYGRAVVAWIARAAKAAGLLPQYRTLESNAGSMQIARSLGFQPFATTVCARFEDEPASE